MIDGMAVKHAHSSAELAPETFSATILRISNKPCALLASSAMVRTTSGCTPCMITSAARAPVMHGQSHGGRYSMRYCTLLRPRLEQDAQMLRRVPRRALPALGVHGAIGPCRLEEIDGCDAVNADGLEQGFKHCL